MKKETIFLILFLIVIGGLIIYVVRWIKKDNDIIKATSPNIPVK